MMKIIVRVSASETDVLRARLEGLQVPENGAMEVEIDEKVLAEMLKYGAVLIDGNLQPEYNVASFSYPLSPVAWVTEKEIEQKERKEREDWDTAVRKKCESWGVDLASRTYSNGTFRAYLVGSHVTGPLTLDSENPRPNLEAQIEGERKEKELSEERERLQEKNEQEKKEKREEERHNWIEKYGSDHLKSLIKEGFSAYKQYRIERTTEEFPNLQTIWDLKDDVPVETLDSPSEELLSLFSKIKEMENVSEIDIVRITIGDEQERIECIEAKTTWNKHLVYLY